MYVDSIFTSNIHAKFNTSNASDYKNALKELIVAIKIVADDPNQFKSIIPTKLSLTMDGIGGIIIGNLFKIPDSSLPRGYKGENGIGRKVGYLVNGLSHKIDTGFWETIIDSQMVILEPNEKGKGKLKYEDIIVQDPVTGEFGVTTTSPPSPNGEMSVAEDNQKYPVLVKYHAWSYDYNSTVQKYAKVSEQTPVANSLRAALDKNYIVEKGVELSSNGDITENLKAAVLSFQSKLKSTSGFEFINAKKPIRITAGNDTYHRKYDTDKCNRTTHGRGLAIDIGTREFSQPQIDNIMNLLKSSGFEGVIYHSGSALHIHANISTT